MTYESHFEVHIIKEIQSKYVIILVEYINATWLHLTSFFFTATAKISTEDQGMAEDSVAIDAWTIKELVKIVKSLQSDMVKLKSRDNGANKLLHRKNHPGLPLYCRPVAKYVAKFPS